MRARLSTPILLLFIAGCNPTGTCIPAEKTNTAPDDPGSQCIINFPKKACEMRSDKPQFFPEDGTAGTLRCKSLGYDDTKFSTKPKDSKETHTYFKK